jgi:hypothetical protein
MCPGRNHLSQPVSTTCCFEEQHARAHMAVCTFQSDYTQTRKLQQKSELLATCYVSERVVSSFLVGNACMQHGTCHLSRFCVRFFLVKKIETARDIFLRKTIACHVGRENSTNCHSRMLEACCLSFLHCLIWLCLSPDFSSSSHASTVEHIASASPIGLLQRHQCEDQ